MQFRQPARQPRFDGTERDFQDFSDFIVSVILQIKQCHRYAMVLVQPAQRVERLCENPFIG